MNDNHREPNDAELAQMAQDGRASPSVVRWLARKELHVRQARPLPASLDTSFPFNPTNWLTP